MIPSAATRTFSLAMIVVAAMTTGCAGWAQRFDSKKIALDRERYGATAD